MEQNQNNQGQNNQPVNGNATAPKAPEKGLKGFLDGLHQKYDQIRYSKTGKWIMRGLTAATILGTGKACYDKGFTKGKASVVPTVVTIEKLPENPEESTEETPAEEVTAEATETV